MLGTDVGGHFVITFFLVLLFLGSLLALAAKHGEAGTGLYTFKFIYICSRCGVAEPQHSSQLMPCKEAWCALVLHHSGCDPGATRSRNKGVTGAKPRGAESHPAPLCPAARAWRPR